MRKFDEELTIRHLPDEDGITQHMFRFTATPRNLRVLLQELTAFQDKAVSDEVSMIISVNIDNVMSRIAAIENQ